jgi:hypothetical protein
LRRVSCRPAPIAMRPNEPGTSKFPRPEELDQCLADFSITLPGLRIRVSRGGSPVQSPGPTLGVRGTLYLAHVDDGLDPTPTGGIW